MNVAKHNNEEGILPAAKKPFDPRMHTARTGQLIITTNVKPIAPLQEPFDADEQRRVPWALPRPVPHVDHGPHPWRRNAQPDSDSDDDDEVPARNAPGRNIHVADLNPQPMTEEDFWYIIGQCQWANKDDGRMGSVGHIKKLSPAKYAQFMEHYDKIYDGLKNILDASRIFAIRGIRDTLEIRKIVSHVIGLGKESYMTIMTGENTFVEYFIDADQCISLDALL